MRLITIGRSSQSQIVIDSPYASSNHAEIYQLDNGDMMIVDKGSGNGTFVNGQRLVPDKEVSVRRNDEVRIADRILDWSQVPVYQIPDRANIKVIKGIGSHYLNAIQVSGSHVSRFHATIKQKKDGKWYICDHSSNGTTVNGVRIPKNQDYRIKKNDTIMCADVPVANPVQGGGILWILLGVAACLCVVAGIWWFVSHIKPDNGPIKEPVTPEKIYNTYASATVLIEMGYYFEVSVLGQNTMNVVYDAERDDLYNYNGSNYMRGSATGFFISPDGKIATCKHVINPALYGVDKDLSDIIKIIVRKNSNGAFALADITVKSKLKYISVCPNGCYYDPDNKVNCRVVAESESPDIDIAVIRTMNQRLPAGVTYVSPRIRKNLPVASTVYTIGFPLSNILQDTNTFNNTYVSKKLEATFSSGSIINNDKNTYKFNASTVSHGASGSPVFDSKGYFVGIVSGMYAVDNGCYNVFEKAENIIPLLKE